MTRLALLLAALNLAAACVLWHHRPRTVALFGDSITAGVYLPAEQRLSARLEARLRSDGYNARVINDGRPSDTTREAMWRLESVIAQQPDVVVIELGVNDAVHRLPAIVARENLREIERQFQEAGAQVILAGVTTAKWDATENYRGLDWLDVMKGVSLRDGLHPDSEGVEQMVEKLAPVVEAGL